MVQIDLKSKTPIYEQIYKQTKMLILKGVLKENDKIPSVRELSAMLTINPNTIQKAYRMLEQDSYIYVIRGRGNFVNAVSDKVIEADIMEIKAQLKGIINKAKIMGMTKAQIIESVDKYYEEE